tara:strand:- start:1632 stop:1871 length:240 start_codon:yes stop_codon:yes gene_type:complete
MKTLVRVMIILLLTSFLGCSQGWSVGGVVLTPQDTVTNTVFIEIMDADSNMHYYYGEIYTSQNWCWRHNEFEDIQIAKK